MTRRCGNGGFPPVQCASAAQLVGRDDLCSTVRRAADPPATLFLQGQDGARAAPARDVGELKAMANAATGDSAKPDPAQGPKGSKEGTTSRLSRWRPRSYWPIFLVLMIGNYIVSRVFF